MRLFGRIEARVKVLKTELQIGGRFRLSLAFGLPDGHFSATSYPAAGSCNEVYFHNWLGPHTSFMLLEHKFQGQTVFIDAVLCDRDAKKRQSTKVSVARYWDLVDF